MDQLYQFMVTNVTSLLAALAILIIGWIVAKVLANAFKALLRKTNLGGRLASMLGRPNAQADVETWGSRIVYYFVMLIVLVAFFQVLGLTLITEPLNRLLIPVFEYLPRLLGAGVLLLVAWIVASLLRALIKRGLNATNWDERLGADANLSTTLSEAVYWLVFLIFLPGILGALEMTGLLGPVQSMIDQILSFLPNLFAAGIILVIGWFVANLVRKIVTNLLGAAGIDKLSERVGLGGVLGTQKLSSLLGLILYVLIFIPVITASLNALALTAVTQPVSRMLDTLLSALPLLFAATIILALAYVIGRVVSNLITNLLTGLGFNRLLVWLGLGQEPVAGERTPAQIAGAVIMAGFMLFAILEVTELLGFTLVSQLVAQFTVFASQLLTGLAIFGIGLYLSNLAAQAIEKSRAAQKGLLALATRVAILVLAGTMALRQVGLATDIINLAFGLILGSIAIAMALAFGLGGRETAAQILAEWRWQGSGKKENLPEQPVPPVTASATAVPTQATPEKPDDLTAIEGIGPKIASVLQAAEITTYSKLAAADTNQLDKILKDAGLRLADPSTWADQARLAAGGKWDELKVLQDSLKGGHRV
jgi:predicted flap endonuclease-1-like 5' DNA nuclease